MQNRIRELRQEREITLEQLAARIGCSHMQVARLERGERRLTVDWMEKVAAALGVTTVSLLPGYPAEEGEVVKDPEERAVLFALRSMDLPERAMFLDMVAGFANKLRARHKTRRRQTA